VKHLRVTASIDPDTAPPFYAALAHSPAVAETRVLEWNTTLDDRETVLFAIDGDAASFAEAAPTTAGVESVELAAGDGRWTHALVEMRTRATPVFGAIRRARTRAGLVVRKPIVYRDGEMRFRVVGDAAALQAGLDEAPDAMDVRIEEIGSPGGVDQPAAASLSERQREAVLVALGLGYYERPRDATHEDVAEELGCAPATASEHLQKAEAKCVRAVMDEFGSDV